MIRSNRPSKGCPITPTAEVTPTSSWIWVSASTGRILSLPYRIIYRVIGESVYVFLIADGRRNIRTLPQRRLLR